MESLRHTFTYFPTVLPSSQSQTGNRSAGVMHADPKPTTRELEQAWQQRLGTSPLTAEKLATLESLLASGKHVDEALQRAACFEAAGIPFNRATAIEHFQEIDQATLHPYAIGRISQATVYLCEYEDQGVRRQAIFKPERKLNPFARNFPQSALHAGVIDVRKGRVSLPPRFALRSVAASRIAERMGIDLLPRSRVATGICDGVHVVGSVTDFCDGESAFACGSRSDDFLAQPAVILDRSQLLSNPAFLEKLLMLGIVDLIIGEPDRNTGNYRVQQNGEVRAIDTEQCFGKKLLTLADMIWEANSMQEPLETESCRPCESGAFYFCDVPAVVTESMKAKVDGLAGKDFADVLDPLGLGDGVGAAKSRLTEVKEKLRQSKVVPDGGLTLNDVRECGRTYLSRDWCDNPRPVTTSLIARQSTPEAMNEDAINGTLHGTSF